MIEKTTLYPLSHAAGTSDASRRREVGQRGPLGRHPGDTAV
jgi:hypothetical protein